MEGTFIESENGCARNTGWDQRWKGGKLVTVHSIWGNSSRTRNLGSVVDFITWQTSQWCSPEHLPIIDETYRHDHDPQKAGDWSVWEAIEADYQTKPAKPVIDAEAWYEGSKPIGDCKAIFQNGGARDYHVRRRAYFTLLAGAAGHTYGAQDVWSKQPNSNQDFLSALDLPGAHQIRHIRTLFESIDYRNGVPDQRLIVEGQSESYDSHVQAFRANNRSYAVFYIADGHDIKVDLGKLKHSQIHGRWMNPRNGETVTISDNYSDGIFSPPGEPECGNDWVLVLDNAQHKK